MGQSYGEPGWVNCCLKVDCSLMWDELTLPGHQGTIRCMEHLIYYAHPGALAHPASL